MGVKSDLEAAKKALTDALAKIEAAAMPEEVQERALKELDRLEKMPFAAPEGVVVRTYLEMREPAAMALRGSRTRRASLRTERETAWRIHQVA